MKSVRECIDRSAETLSRCGELSPEIELLAREMASCLSNHGTIFWCGNGGSAADAQHLAAELVGRYAMERPPLSSLALTVDSSALTAIANDYGYEEVFRRQVRALVRPHDFVIGISTSGKSRNVLLALREAREIGATTASLSGSDASLMSPLSDFTISVPSAITADIQTCHIAIGQTLCGWVESALFTSELPS